MTTKKPKAATSTLALPDLDGPPTLSQPARSWFRRMKLEYAIEDAGGLLLLTAAAEAFDRAREADEIVRRDGLTVVGRFGLKQHPCIAISRDARGQMLQALRALNLDLEPAHAGPGRPPNAA